MNTRRFQDGPSFRGAPFRAGQIWQTPYGTSRLFRVGNNDCRRGGGPGSVPGVSFGEGVYSSSLWFEIIDENSPINPSHRQFRTDTGVLEDLESKNLPNDYGGPFELLVDSLGVVGSR